jgi:hypothetical protein
MAAHEENRAHLKFNESGLVGSDERMQGMH